MDKKFLIFVFAVVFCNGVTYSYPVDEQQIFDPKLSAEKQPTADHINKKIEATSVPSVQQPSVSQNSSTPAPSQVPIAKNETVHPAAVNTTTSVSQPVNGNVTQDNSQNATVVVVDNKNSSHPAEPVTVPTDKSVTDMPRPTTPGQTTTVSPTTAAAPVIKTDKVPTTTASPTAKPTVVTLPPTPKSVVIEQNVPAPAAEKHFDGPSFIGGIVLTIGLTAIGFIAFKYYKSGKIDMNYRTL